jgi:hypothetical protein
MRQLHNLLAIACGTLFVATSLPARADPAEPESTSAVIAGDAPVSPKQQSESETRETRASKRRQRSPSLFAGGLTMAIAGGVATSVGATMIILGADACMGVMCDARTDVRHPNEGLETAGIVVLATGAAMVLVGIPLAVSGGRSDPPRAEPPPRAMLVPVVGPRQAGSALTITF